MFSWFVVFARLGFSSYAQPTRLDADLDLLPVKSGTSASGYEEGRLAAGIRDESAHEKGKS
jgi:hypothetical protein